MSGSGLPIKKSVELRWRGSRVDFDVAQDLFSSHQVDRGSRMLLDSLEPASFPADGRAADFGCGYGVLGVAWQVAHPRWSMHYVDRDALAVAFSRQNARRLVPDFLSSSQFTCDVYLPIAEGGYDLVLWNVPGKAGRDVIAGLLQATIDTLVPGGVLAVVVVHPLADLFTGELQRTDAETAHIERGKEHTVVHIRRRGGEVTAREPFAAGLFDRPAHEFSMGELSWSLRTVYGLPEYDSLDRATELAIQAMASLQHGGRGMTSWMVLNPGAGHLAVVARKLWPEARGKVHGRDALAVRTTIRALADGPGVEAYPVWDVAALEGSDPVDLIEAALPEQSRVDELGKMLDALGRRLVHGGVAILHGRSTEVARVGAAARTRSGWRLGAVVKLRGSAAVTARLN